MISASYMLYVLYMPEWTGPKAERGDSSLFLPDWLGGCLIRMALMLGFFMVRICVSEFAFTGKFPWVLEDLLPSQCIKKQFSCHQCTYCRRKETGIRNILITRMQYNEWNWNGLGLLCLFCSGLGCKYSVGSKYKTVVLSTKLYMWRYSTYLKSYM